MENGALGRGTSLVKRENNILAQWRKVDLRSAFISPPDKGDLGGSFLYLW